MIKNPNQLILNDGLVMELQIEIKQLKKSLLKIKKQNQNLLLKNKNLYYDLLQVKENRKFYTKEVNLLSKIILRVGKILLRDK